MTKLSGLRAYAALLGCATMAITSAAQTFTTLHSFDGTDGASPHGGLVQAIDGNLYGMSGPGQTGTVFKMTTIGTLTTLYNFCSQPGCTDGNDPYQGLVQAKDGNLYGTTHDGGANNSGTVFKITPSGVLTTLYTFCSQSGCTDGSNPATWLIQATDGNLYGTTVSGGANDWGTVFKITVTGTLTTLHSFNVTDGANPYAGVIQATDRNFYGVTQNGGAHFDGTVFKITPSGVLTTLHNFNGRDGSLPFGGVIQATDGNFYGTTFSGGANNAGTLFKITSRGTLMTLHNFCSEAGCTDGQSPEGAPVQANDGNLYGTASGVSGGIGTIFKSDLSGNLTTLYTFCSQPGCVDGSDPIAALIQDTDGNLYGTTFVGGASNLGTVFSLSVGLAPFVETQPSSGHVGAAVKILGTNLTGATSVSFNGTAATFSVISSSLIKTSVPTGATTGNVQVVTPNGTLSSNVPFRVL